MEPTTWSSYAVENWYVVVSKGFLGFATMSLFMTELCKIFRGPRDERFRGLTVMLFLAGFMVFTSYCEFKAHFPEDPKSSHSNEDLESRMQSRFDKMDARFDALEMRIEENDKKSAERTDRQVNSAMKMMWIRTDMCFERMDDLNRSHATAVQNVTEEIASRLIRGLQRVAFP